ncbi:glycosyltransferase [Vibrio breoganii]
MIKIIFFVESLYCGGAERSLLSLLSNLDKRKYDIEILMSKPGGEFEKFLPSYIRKSYIEPKVNIFDRIAYKLLRVVNPRQLHHAQLLWQVIGKKQELYNYSKNDYQIAIAWGQGFATYYTAEKINALKKYAWVNIDFERAGYSEIVDKPLYDKFDKVVGVSEFVQRSMQKFLEDNKVLFIKNIIDADDVIEKSLLNSKVNFNKNVFNIVSVGRLAKQKAFTLVLETARELVSRDLKFHWYIIGEGEERQILEDLIDKYNLRNNVTLLGFIENPYPYIKEADIYCQTSLFEGLGRVLIEATHLNKVTVSTDFPTAYSIIDQEVTGCIVSMDKFVLADKISSLILDEEYLKTLESNLEKLDLNTKKETLKSFDRLTGVNNEN